MTMPLSGAVTLSKYASAGAVVLKLANRVTGVFHHAASGSPGLYTLELDE